MFQNFATLVMHKKKHLMFHPTECVLFCDKSAVSAISTDCAWCFAVFSFITGDNTAKYHEQSVEMALTEDLTRNSTHSVSVLICFLLRMPWWVPQGSEIL